MIRKPPPTPVGDARGARRVDILKKGLREMAKLLNIAPAHLTDIEKGPAVAVRRPADVYRSAVPG